MVAKRITVASSSRALEPATVHQSFKVRINLLLVGGRAVNSLGKYLGCSSRSPRNQIYERISLCEHLCLHPYAGEWQR